MGGEGGGEGGLGGPTGALPTIAENDTFLKRFRIVEKIGEGSYSEVVKCKNRESGIFVACKRLKHVYKSWNQVNDIAEVTTLRTLTRHPHILQMLEIHYDVRHGKVSLVFEIMDMNLYELIKDRKRLLPEHTVRLYMFQLLKALRHLHKYGVFHRDIKPENILIRTKSNVLKLGDLGSVRGIYSQPPFTEYISTRWYRSPECLLTAGQYGFKMDIWAAGCVFYEILTLQPLFPGSSEIDQINRIHTTMGPPTHKTLQKFSKFAQNDKELYRSKNQQNRWDAMLKVINEFWKNPKHTERSKSFDWNTSGKEKVGLEGKLPSYLSPGARSLVKQMLTYDPDARPSSARIINDAYFNDVRDFKIPESEIVKSPIIAVCGDEFGRIMISHYYGHVDLKTLGDKKPPKRMKMQFAQAQKQQQEPMALRRSSPILRGAKSPETPEMEMPVLNIEVKNPVNPVQSSGLKPNEYNKHKLQEKSRHDSPPKKTMKTDQSPVAVESGNKNQHATEAQDKNQKIQNINPTVPKKSMIPEMFIARKRQVLTGNIPPSRLVLTQDDELNTNYNATDRNQPAEHQSPARAQNRPSKLPVPDVPSPGLSSKIINYQITSEELNKINETRQLVHMEPIGKFAMSQISTNGNTEVGKHQKRESEPDPNSPYIKPPEELSASGRKKLLIQKLRQQAAKRLAVKPRTDSTMNVPPQVAAAALKFQTQAAVAAQKAREAFGDLSIPTKLNKKLNGHQPGNNKENNSNSNGGYSFGKSNFGLKKLGLQPENDTSPQQKLHQIADHLERNNKGTVGSKKQDSFTFKTPFLNSALRKKQDTNDALNHDISKALELDKQNRISLRNKDHVLNHPKNVRNTKIPSLNKSLTNENFNKPVAKVEFGSPGAQNISEAGGSLIFPRNRFGSDPIAHNTMDKGEKSDLIQQFHEVKGGPIRSQRYAPEDLGSTFAEDKGPVRLGPSILPGTNDWKNNNAVTRSKPPLPPKYIGATVYRSDMQKNNSNGISKETRIAQILDNAAAAVHNTRRAESSSSLQPKTFGVFNEAEAIKRRTERIRAQLRDEIYCSSDDDIVSSMRHKLDILISERARRASDTSYDSVNMEEDEGNNFETRTKHLRPRKLLRKETLDIAEIEVETPTLHSLLAVGDAKKGRQYAGAAATYFENRHRQMQGKNAFGTLEHTLANQKALSPIHVDLPEFSSQNSDRPIKVTAPWSNVVNSVNVRKRFDP